ncbi:MAG TPA: exonuclease SbcCD subunit D [bacterium]|nr:exonuclease SbcCD subunit D [bacterium]HNT66345.1 exonuclease SbcCD subunit D [bacterium]HOX87269.1 exonuclease SbcCD subunit D [bacterium]HPG46730.1 exonuclease SbcCD subunit D [bacterium]HPM98738.1 exonuclease SbcCD subunit D [bacterium]
MKILHFSDTHLGFSEYHRLDPVSGINQREQDFYSSWNQVIAAVQRLRPDIVIHAGDLFHTPRPSNRAIHMALQGFKQIDEMGVPVVVVAGNHETPRIRSTGSIFESIALYPQVHAAFNYRSERFTIGTVDIHCLPHCSLAEELQAAVESIEFRPQAEANILVAHGAWGGKDRYEMGEFNEQRLPDIEAILDHHFDYIALGHYHRQVKVAENGWYSGSTERTSFNEAGNRCGFLQIDLQSKAVEKIELSTRPMRRLAPIDCSGLATQQIYDALAEQAAADLDGAIVQLTLQNLEENSFVALAMEAVEEIFAGVFHLEKHLLPRVTGSRSSQSGEYRIDSLPVEFHRYLDTRESVELDIERLKQLGTRYLTQDGDNSAL